MDRILAALPWVLLCPAVCIWVLKWPRLHKAGARLASGLALGPMLGVVLNGMNMKSVKYSYKSKYGKYGYKYKYQYRDSYET